MPFIPRQRKAPPRLAISCKLPQEVVSLLRLYTEFLDSSQEYVVAEVLRLTFRRDREFQTWLATVHPEVSVTPQSSLADADEPPRRRRARGRSAPAAPAAVGRSATREE